MIKEKLVIYEGAMCCSTGVCGPEPDKTLIDLNETLKKLHTDYKGLKITRASLSFGVEEFLKNEEIFKVVKINGPSILPITTIDGKIIAKQRYLSYPELKKELES